MMELAAIYKQRSVECERRERRKKDQTKKLGARVPQISGHSRSKSLRTPLGRACTSLEILRRIGGHPRQCLTDQPPVALSSG